MGLMDMFDKNKKAIKDYLNGKADLNTVLNLDESARVELVSGNASSIKSKELYEIIKSVSDQNKESLIATCKENLGRDYLAAAIQTIDNKEKQLEMFFNEKDSIPSNYLLEYTKGLPDSDKKVEIVKSLKDELHADHVMEYISEIKSEDIKCAALTSCGNKIFESEKSLDTICSVSGEKRKELFSKMDGKQLSEGLQKTKNVFTDKTILSDMGDNNIMEMLKETDLETTSEFKMSAIKSMETDIAKLGMCDLYQKDRVVGKDLFDRDKVVKGFTDVEMKEVLKNAISTEGKKDIINNYLTMGDKEQSEQNIISAKFPYNYGDMTQFVSCLNDQERRIVLEEFKDKLQQKDIDNIIDGISDMSLEDKEKLKDNYVEIQENVKENSDVEVKEQGDVSLENIHDAVDGVRTAEMKEVVGETNKAIEMVQEKEQEDKSIE